MTRLEFLGSLLGLGVATRAIARLNPASVAPPPLSGVAIWHMSAPTVEECLDDDHCFLASEFLRLFMNETAIEAGPYWEADDVPRLRSVHTHHAGVSLALSDEAMYDARDIRERLIAPAASALAEYLRDEERRGGRGLCFSRLRLPRGVARAAVSSSLPRRYSVRCLAQFQEYAYDEQRRTFSSESAWVMRFDVLYRWTAREPLRPKRPFLRFDPARLPA